MDLEKLELFKKASFKEKEGLVCFLVKPQLKLSIWIERR